MKQLIILVLLIHSIITGSAQSVLPRNFLEKSVGRSAPAGALAPSFAPADSSRPKQESFFFVTIKHKEEFENSPTEFFQTNIINYNDSLNNIALYTELASDFIGPVRVGVGGTFSYPKTDTNTVVQKQLNREAFIQRFATGGGSLVLNGALPIFNTTGTYISGGIYATAKGGINPPSFGISTSAFPLNGSLGADFQLDIKGINDVIHIFANGRVAYMAGNPSFYDALELTGSDRKGFFMTNYTIGLQIKDIFRISYSGFGGTSFIKQRLTGFLSFTIEPSFK